MIIPNDPFIGTYYIGKEELKAVKTVIKSKSLFRYHGPNMLYKTDEFEKNMSIFLNVKYVLACSNGAAALKLACIGCGIGPGDEVLMSPFTFIASASSVLACGAIPKFVDIDETMNIDPKKIKEAITSNTKAIMAIHMQGQPCDMTKINKIAKENNLKVIEDVAQAFGSSIKGKMSGTFGDCGAFSLQAGKTITCGEGGFFATNNKKIYELAKMYHDNGGYRKGQNYPTWENGKTFYGENYKLTELQSAVAIEQLKKIDLILKFQKENYDYLISKIDQNYYNLRPCIDEHKIVNVSLAINFKDKKECQRFIKFMNEKGIAFNNYCSNLIDKFDTFKYKQSWHRSNFPYNISNYHKRECKNAEILFKKVAWFNLSASLRKKHLKYIILAMEEYKNEKQ
ncbi:MAG: DegT/DnrJ/EryC1/StrS family aminotransferase [Bacilli bacterium]|nr:DegT/DnrJ/EryC1/StrS family aminotransferase [Bacilli bacterium]